jgi:hypothetical protein
MKTTLNTFLHRTPLPYIAQLLKYTEDIKLNNSTSNHRDRTPFNSAQIKNRSKKNKQAKQSRKQNRK